LATVGAFDLQNGAVGHAVAEARLLAFELMPMCANIKTRFRSNSFRRFPNGSSVADVPARPV
jgi:hypothetical protein